MNHAAFLSHGVTEKIVRDINLSNIKQNTLKPIFGTSIKAFPRKSFQVLHETFARFALSRYYLEMVDRTAAVQAQAIGRLRGREETDLGPQMRR